jgi:hypothetical protein
MGFVFKLRALNSPSRIPSAHVVVVGLAIASGALGACASGDASIISNGAPSDPSGPCEAVSESFTVNSAMHVADCSALEEASNPPAGGDHYGTWAAFQSYTFPIPHGFLIHSMEHGAVVFYYNCPDGCADEVSRAQALLDAQAADPLCAGNGVLRRAILLPDPTLDVRWAASAWGSTLRANCFDEAVFGDFYRAHYDKGPEKLCVAGVAFAATPCE